MVEKFDRRAFLSLVGFTLASAVPTTAQAQSLQAFALPAFAERLQQRQFLDQIYADVVFVHSWRFALAPKGYENEADWQESARGFVSQVFNLVWKNPSEMVAASASKFEEYSKEALATYEANKSGFDEFVTIIGIDVSGKAASRILESMQGFLILAVAANDVDVAMARRSSYFWPLC